MSYAIGIDIGGTRTKTGLVELETQQIAAVRVTATDGGDEQTFLDFVRGEIDELIKQQKSVAADSFSVDQIVGIGISIGSYIFPDQGIVDTMDGFINIPDHYPLRELLERHLHIPCRIENDARLIGYAESRFGAGKDYKRVLTLTLGTGVGAGFTADKDFPDSEACIHLAGHIKVREAGSEPPLDQSPCYCSVQGCLESTCSGTALQKMGRYRFGADMTNEKLFEAAGKGDGQALELITRYLDYLSVGLNEYVYVFAPDVIVLGGGVAKGLKPYLEYLKSKVTAKIHSLYTVEIKVSGLNEDGGILGAAGLFMD